MDGFSSLLTRLLVPMPMTVIMSHGYAGTRLEKGLPALALAKAIVDAGYHVLMFDFRNSGNSEGNITTVGSLEKEDVLGAIDWVQEHIPSKICFTGFFHGRQLIHLGCSGRKSRVGCHYG